MFCKNCGKELSGGMFCPNCGAAQGAQPAQQSQPQYQQQQPPRKKGIGVTGMILGILSVVSALMFGFTAPQNVGVAFFLGLPGLIFGIIGAAKKNGTGMAVTGIICSVLGILFAFLISFIMVA